MAEKQQGAASRRHRVMGQRRNLDQKMRAVFPKRQNLNLAKCAPRDFSHGLCLLAATVLVARRKSAWR